MDIFARVVDLFFFPLPEEWVGVTIVSMQKNVGDCFATGQTLSQISHYPILTN